MVALKLLELLSTDVLICLTDLPSRTSAPTALSTLALSLQMEMPMYLRQCAPVGAASWTSHVTFPQLSPC